MCVYVCMHVCTYICVYMRYVCAHVNVCVQYVVPGTGLPRLLGSTVGPAGAECRVQTVVLCYLVYEVWPSCWILC